MNICLFFPPLNSCSVCVCVLVAQSCPTPCNPRDCSLTGSSFMDFSRQEYWSGLPGPPPGDLLNPGIEPGSPALQADSLPSQPPRKPSLAAHFSSGQFSSVTQLCPWLNHVTGWPHEPQHTRPPCPSPNPRVHPELSPLSWWCHPTI